MNGDLWEDGFFTIDLLWIAVFIVLALLCTIIALSLSSHCITIVLSLRYHFPLTALPFSSHCITITLPLHYHLIALCNKHENKEKQRHRRRTPESHSTPECPASPWMQRGRKRSREHLHETTPPFQREDGMPNSLTHSCMVQARNDSRGQKTDWIWIRYPSTLPLSPTSLPESQKRNCSSVKLSPSPEFREIMVSPDSIILGINASHRYHSSRSMCIDAFDEGRKRA